MLDEIEQAPSLGHVKLRFRYRSFILPALLSVAVAGAPACQGSGTDRWVTTSNTNVAIDWDAVGKAYQEADGPADFEKRVNEIYEGDEIISVAVVDKDDKTQVITGFFDANESGAIDEGEKIFELTRKITGEGAGEYAVSGYGAYAGYHSPALSIMTGMMLGSMIMGPMRPGYVMMAPYTTSPAQRGQLASSRSSYRSANPARFSKSSQSGRSYGSGKSFGGGSSSRPRSGGGRFGLQAATRKGGVRRLDA